MLKLLITAGLIAGIAEWAAPGTLRGWTEPLLASAGDYLDDMADKISQPG